MKRANERQTLRRRAVTRRKRRLHMMMDLRGDMAERTRWNAPSIPKLDISSLSAWTRKFLDWKILRILPSMNFAGV